MKLEIRKAEFLVPNAYCDDYGEGELEIYITRKQFMNEFEADEAACIKLLQNIAEMFTAPHCFELVPSAESIRKLYDYLNGNPKGKGIVMQITENNNCQLGLGMYIVK